MSNREITESVLVAEAMILYGGSFVHDLGRALRHADLENALKIKNAFPEYWAKYKEIDVVEDWNDRYQPGTVVDVETDDGSIIKTKTRSVAKMLEGHTPVIWLEDIRGAYALYRVSSSEDQGGDEN